MVPMKNVSLDADINNSEIGLPNTYLHDHTLLCFFDECM